MAGTGDIDGGMHRIRRNVTSTYEAAAIWTANFATRSR